MGKTPWAEAVSSTMEFDTIGLHELRNSFSGIRFLEFVSWSGEMMPPSFKVPFPGGEDKREISGKAGFSTSQIKIG
jgi:hypothetical protein